MACIEGLTAAFEKHHGLITEMQGVINALSADVEVAHQRIDKLEVK